MVGVRMVKDRPDLFSAYVGNRTSLSFDRAEVEPEISSARTLSRLSAWRMTTPELRRAAEGRSAAL